MFLKHPVIFPSVNEIMYRSNVVQRTEALSLLAEVQYCWKTGRARIPASIDFGFEIPHHGAVLVQMAWKLKESNQEIG